MSRIFQTKSRVAKNTKVGPRYYKIILFAPAISRTAKPGQFIDIKLSNGFNPLLRRPFSINNVDKSRLEILYEVVGKGSEILSQKKSGEYLDMLGALGNSFYPQPATNKKQQAILVAGGIGVAPLVFLTKRFPGPKPLVLIGAKTRGDILCEKEFKKLGCDVKIATDDGSRGFHGKVTDLLKKILCNNAINAGNVIALYACGPRPMLKEISMISRRHQIQAQVSLEEHMSCGFGACLGCVVDTIDGYKRVCKEGPVFEAEKIIW